MGEMAHGIQNLLVDGESEKTTVAIPPVAKTTQIYSPPQAGTVKIRDEATGKIGPNRAEGHDGVRSLFVRVRGGESEQFF